MTEKLGIYKCLVCGNIVEVLHTGKGELVCCGKPMQLMKENTVDASKEKHVPVVEKTDGGIKVTIGSAPHPMEDAHYIEWAQLISKDKSFRIFLSPGNSPEAVFETVTDDLVAREYCNIHGLWKA